MLTDAEKEAALEWYSSCDDEYLEHLVERLQYVIQERKRRTQRIVARLLPSKMG